MSERSDVTIEMKKDPTDPDRNLATRLKAVALAGLALTLVAPLVVGLSATLGVGLGALLAVANLWAIAFVVRGFLRGASLSFGALGALKLGVLLLVVVLIVKNGLADVLPLAFGYAALPIGIVMGELGGGAARRQA